MLRSAVGRGRRAARIGGFCQCGASDTGRQRLAIEPLEDRRLLAFWTPIGPGPILDGQVAGMTAQQNPVAGAVQAVAPHPTDANILYVGAVNGGIWRTNNALSLSPTWTPLTDDRPSLSIGDLQFDPTDATNNTLIAGIGRFSSLFRDGGDLTGLLRTTDGGNSWTEITGGGLLAGKNITGTVARGNVIVMAVNGATPFALASIGIFRSTDGGASFSHVNGAAGSGLPMGRALELVADPVNPQILYSSLTDGGANNGIYKSSDTGATWTRVSSPEMNALIVDTGTRTSNVQMSVGRSDNPFVGIVNGGLLAGFFRSGDGGGVWTAMDIPVTNEDGTNVGINPIKTGPRKPDIKPADDPGGQGAIHFSVVADPTNPNIVYAGGDRQPMGAFDLGVFPNSIGAVNFTGRLFRGDASLAAGSQWTPLTDNFADPDGTGPLPGTGPHADSRDMAFDAAGNLIESDDGGVYKRVSPTSTTGVWSSLNGNLQITEFVSVGYSSLTHTALGGTQDVGTPVQTSATSNAWLEVIQGDGGFVAVDDTSQPGLSIRYGSSQFLGGFGSITVDANGQFVASTVAPLVVNGTGGMTLFEVDSPQFYTPVEINSVNPGRLVFGTQTRIFETLDRGATVNDLGSIGTTSTFAYGGTSGGSANADVLYVGTDTGLFLRSSFGGALTELTSYPGNEPEDIALDPTDWRFAAVVDQENVYLTSDGGQTWTTVTGGLDDSELRTVEIVVGFERTGVLVGGNAGVQLLRLGLSSLWFEAAEGLAGAPVIDLHYNAADDVILAGTLGRGAWIVADGSQVLLQAGLTIDDVTLFEGNEGFTSFVFTVSQPSNSIEVTVAFATLDGTADSATDYIAVSGSLTFAVGETIRSVTIQVVGDIVVEANESFVVRLSDAVNGDIAKADGVGTILNDDLDLTVNDVTVVEGNTGSKNVVFTVSAVGFISQTASVRYSTLDDTATAPADYSPRAGELFFTPGTTSALVTVPVHGDTLNEGAETFLLFLFSAKAARIADNSGVASIIDDDPLPGLYVNDVQLTTTAAGGLAAVFSVALSTASGRDVSVHFGTADGAAINGVDYVGQSGQLTIPRGTLNQQITVPVMTSADYSPNKKFYLNLAEPSGAFLADAQGAATIVFATGPQGEYILDDNSPGYTRSLNGWTTLTNTLAYNLDYDYANAGNGSATATWSFTAIPNGAFEVFVRWTSFSNRATNAPYTVQTGNTTLGTVLVNQQVAPAGDQSNGVTWHSLGLFTAANNKLSVRLANNANGVVVADAVRIVRDGIAPQVPEMDVSSFERSITPGDATPAFDDGSDFGETTPISGSVTHAFAIANNGNAPLHLTGSPPVTILGANAADFTVIAQPAATVAPGQETTFQVTFRPGAVGLRTATISIANDDDSEHPYTFTIQGTGSGPAPTTFVVDDSMAAYSQVGEWSTSADALAYQGQSRASAAGQGTDNAVWSFAGLTPGSYDVYVTWSAGADRATNAPFTVSNLGDNSYTVFVNQKQAPQIAIGGVNWSSLGILETSGGALEVSLADNANGVVVADAVMVVRHGTTPTPVVQLPVVPPPQTATAHNAVWPEDVNGDNRVTPRDLLAVINQLISQSDVAAPLAATAATGTPNYVDVNGDGRVSPSDALRVINYLLSASAASAAPQAAIVAAPSASAAVDQALVLFDDTADEDAAQPLLAESTSGSSASEVATSSGSSSPLLISAAVGVTLAAEEADDEVLVVSDLELSFVDG